jgi:uncharacterized protein YndB with AHSA1/START domain
MANYGGQTLVIELPSRPEGVWDALTDPSALNQWFGETNFLARAGLPFSLRPHADGDLPAGAGEVVAVEPPRRLVLRWRADGRVLALTIVVEPGPGGTVLRVAYSDTGGIDEIRLTALRRLYDERLRAFLSGAPLPVGSVPHGSVPDAPTLNPAPVATGGSRVGPPPAAAASAAPSRPASEPVPTAVRTPGSAPGSTRRRALPVVAGAAVPVVLVLVAWTVAGSNLTWGAPGAEGAPTAPASIAGPAATNTTTASAPTANISASRASTSASPSASAASGPLTVAARVTDRQPNSLTVAVTITNPTATGQTWRNVAVGLSATNLTLSNVDPRVNYEWAGTRACFSPGPAVTTIAAGTTVTFPFTVSGAVPADVAGASLNHADCS